MAEALALVMLVSLKDGEQTGVLQLILFLLGTLQCVCARHLSGPRERLRL